MEGGVGGCGCSCSVQGRVSSTNHCEQKQIRSEGSKISIKAQIPKKYEIVFTQL